MHWHNTAGSAGGIHVGAFVQHLLIPLSPLPAWFLMPDPVPWMPCVCLRLGCIRELASEGVLQQVKAAATVSPLHHLEMLCRRTDRA